MAKSICVAKLVTTEVNSYDAVVEKRGTHMAVNIKIAEIYGCSFPKNGMKIGIDPYPYDLYMENIWKIDGKYVEDVQR